MVEALSMGQPWSLLLLVALPALLLVGRRRVAALGRVRALLSLVLRLTLFALLVVALTDPRVLLPDRRLSVVFAVDQSSSISVGQAAFASDWVAQAAAAAPNDDEVALIGFGRQPIVQQLSLARPPADQRPAVDGSATDLAAAVRLAGELASTDSRQPRVVLLSAGWETSNRVLDQVSWLTAQGVSVSYVPLVANDGPEVAIQRIDAPPAIREGETADVSVAIASSVTTPATVSLSEDDQPGLKHPLQLSAGTTSVSLRYTPTARGTHVLRADLLADLDTLSKNNHAEAVITVKPPARALLVEGRPGEGDLLAAALQAARVEVERATASGVPVRAVDLAEYDAVVLDNVQATALSLDAQLTLASYVRDMGRGLVVVGGQNSLSMGAYADTELEKMLPLRATPPDRHEQGVLALLLVIDTSGSMSLATPNHVVKLEMAKQAAAQAVSLLKPTDTVGVLVFNTRYQWVVAPQVVADNGGLPDIQSRISSIKAVGGTDIYAALESAFQTMSQLNVRFRHVLLLTDGQSPSPNYEALVSRNQALGVTLSTVAIGADSDTSLLSKLAQLGGGRSYATQRFDDIPSIVAKETAIASRSSLAEGQFKPIPADPSPLLNGLDVANVPNLGGYVQTTARPGATIALTSPRQDPILAHWHYGLGRVVAWTADAGNLWANDWFTSPSLTGFFAQIAQWTMATPANPRLSITTQASGKLITVAADSVEPDGAFGDGLDTRATVVTPASTATEIRLQQWAPGRYERAFSVEDPGIYRILVRQVQPSGEVLEEMTGAVVDDIEQRSIGMNQTLLEELAAQTGGRRLETPADAFARGTSASGHAWQPIWQWLVAAALVLFPIDVAIRRLQVSVPRRLIVQRPPHA